MHHRQIHPEQDEQLREVLSFSGFSMATSFSEPVMPIDNVMFVLTVPEP